MGNAVRLVHSAHVQRNRYAVDVVRQSKALHRQKRSSALHQSEFAVCSAQSKVFEVSVRYATKFRSILLLKEAVESLVTRGGGSGGARRHCRRRRSSHCALRAKFNKGWKLIASQK